MSVPSGQPRKRGRDGECAGSKWVQVRAVSKFLGLQIDVNRVPPNTEPTTKEIDEHAHLTYQRYDKDKNGKLDLDEFREMLLDIGASHAHLHRNRVEQFIQVEQLFRRTDSNQDNWISFDEFLNLYQRMLKWDRDRVTLRAPRPPKGSEPSSPRLHPESLEESCPRTMSPPVLVDNTEFVVDSRYRLDQVLGRGAYGVIAAGEDTTSSPPRRVVVKKVAATGHPIELQATYRELMILRHIRRHPHDNLITLLDIAAPPPGPLEQWQSLCLVMQRMDCDLHAIIRSTQPLTDQHLQFFTYQLLRGLRALHSAGVVHRDLKPANLLVNQNCDLRIADFGISREVPEGNADMSSLASTHTADLTNYVVTRYYRAPELLLECKRYGFAVDIWSVGCIIAEVMLRRPLMCGRSSMHQLELIAEHLGTPADSERGELMLRHKANPTKMEVLVGSSELGLSQAERPNRVTEVLRSGTTLGAEQTGGSELCVGMLRYSPSSRLSLDDALAHSWLSALHECNEEPRLPPIHMPALPGRGVSRKTLQQAAVDTLREMQPSAQGPGVPE